MRARPHRAFVADAPHQPGDVVRIVQAIDREVHDVARFVGRVGRVEYLEYRCGCGQTYPQDPMIGVVFLTGEREEFWREEIEAVDR